MIYNTATLDVEVEYSDFESAREDAIARGRSVDILRVPAEVDLDEALAEASVEQLREALGREAPGYTEDQLDAIRDCFACLCQGDSTIALALLSRIFEHPAQIWAAEQAIRACRPIKTKVEA